MTRDHGRRVLLAALLAASPAAMARAAHAQEASGGSSVQEVVVTGSHIRSNGMQTPVPITVISAAELKSMAPTTLIEGVTQLPQFYNSQTPASPASWFTRAGYGNLDIRGLGPNRTLTLLNGRRVISQTAFGGVDINMLPQDLVRSVETVTGGASAAYGTDAVAGVANFILDTNFTGLRVNLQSGETTRGDADNYGASAAWGVRIGDKAHLLVSGELFNQAGVHNYQGRDWYQGWGTVPNSSGMLLIRPHVVSRGSSFDGIIFAPGSPLNGMVFNRDGSGVHPFVTSDTSSGTIGTPPARQSVANGGSGDDLGSEVQTLYPDLKRYSFFAYADYQLKPDFKVFAQYLRGTEETFRYNSPRGSLQGTPTAVTIFSGNAFLPASVQQIMSQTGLASFTLRRTGSAADIGADISLRDASVMNSLTTGFNWDINSKGLFNGWQVDGYYQYGHNTRHGYQIGLRVDRIFAAVDAVRDPSGNIVCRTTLYSSTFAGCQPLDLFGRGAASAAGVDYVVGNDPGQKITTPLYFADGGYGPNITDSYTAQEAKVTITTMQQHVAELSMNGQVFRGWGAGPVTAAFGGAYRKESILQIVRDSTNIPSDHVNGRPVMCNNAAIGLRGVNAADCTNTVGIQYSKVSNIIGDIEVKEAFVETQAPIVADLPFMRLLKTDLAARWADYSGSGSIWAYKGGIDADIVDGLRLRGTYSRDVRAANLSERFDKTGGVATVTDPRHPADGSVNVTIFSGGNPNVKPEKADTFTAGVVVQPHFLEGFSASVDWYRIRIKDAIGQLTTQNVVNQCEAGAADLCALITRDPATDRLVLVGNTYVNINEAVVRGVDFEAGYRHDVRLIGGNESVSGRLFGTWLLENSTTNLGAAKIDRAGQTGIQQSDGAAYALPKFKASGNITYTNGAFSAFVQGRYIGPGTLENALVVGKDIESNHVDSVFYTDARLSYRFERGDNAKLEFYATVTNLFDVAPPVTPYWSAFTGYTIQDNSALFDVLGRRFVVGARFQY
jgi:outer membrane receptor protein involved in Fe transport